MPFDWMDVPHQPNPDAFKDQVVRSVSERARLLCRLGYTQKAAVARCQAHLAWEFELDGGVPMSQKDIRGLVRQAFGRPNA